MNVEMLIREIEEAFASVHWPYDSPPCQLTPEATEAVVEDLFLMPDKDKAYELAKALGVVITQAEPPLRDRLLCRLIEFLDVDFYDLESTNDLLKAAKQKVFSNCSTAQSLAIWKWLTFVKVTYELRDCHRELTSAIRYWGRRLRSQT